MTATPLYDVVFWGWLGMSALVFCLLFFVSAPYGRMARQGWGPQIPTRLAWLVMELPAVLTILVFWILAGTPTDLGGLCLLGMWEAHYINRTFIYPFRTRTKGKQTPLVIALMGGSTNVGVGYLVGFGIFTVGAPLGTEWLCDPRYILGALIFGAGMIINIQSDNILLGLRKEGDTGYHIPSGGGYRWVSCPNYLGEILEWIGFAIASWSLGGLAFAVWTMSNLIPRALSSHRWYQRTFEDYPKERRAVLPFLL